MEPDSVWVLHLTGGSCATETFATHHTFTDSSDDTGVYRGSTHLRMKWKKGALKGYTFSGQWNRTSGDYSGAYEQHGPSYAATLDPVSSGSCKIAPPVTA